MESGRLQTPDALFEQVYDRLKAMAGKQLARGPRGTLQTTALVHELYLRLAGREELRFDTPMQFYAYAARAMRHLLADRARDRLTERAGGDWARVTLNDEVAAFALDSAEQALSFEQALKRLEAADERAARMVELVFFAGLTQDQAGEVLGVTRRTIVRDWRFARAFLKAEFEIDLLSQSAGEARSP